MTAEASSVSPLLSMRAISKSFGGIPALSAATLDVNAGEVHALIGQNGAGKSTMIKILTGYVVARRRRDCVRRRARSRPVLRRTRNPRASARSTRKSTWSRIDRSPKIFVSAARAANIGLLDWSAMHAEARALLARFQIDVDVRRPLMRFSTATQQMVAIARAIGFQARLVIMDEPTSSLDEREVKVLFDVIRQLKASGVSVVFVSHKLDELYAVCDRVTIMRDGRTVRVADMKDISKVELVASMLGRDVAQVAKSATAFGGPSTHIGATSLEAQHLSAGHKVHDVSFSVRRGEIVGFAGLLGSGRTETARVVFGADAAQVGRIDPRRREFQARRARRCDPSRDRVRVRGSQARGHHSRHVGRGKSDAGAVAATDPRGRRSTPPSSARSC